MDAETLDDFAALFVNRARWRVIRLRHFKEIIVGVGAEQNARMAVRVAVVLGLREQNIQPHGIQRHAVHRGQHARRPVRIFVRLDAVVERRIRKMHRISAPFASAVKSVQHKQNRLRAEVGRGRHVHERRIGVFDRLLIRIDHGVQFPRPFDRAEMIFAAHGDGGLTGIAILHVVVRIGMRLEQRQIDEISGVENLFGNQLGLLVFAVGIDHSLHPVRRLQAMIIAVARILRLARLGRRGLDETDVLELAPHLREDVRRDEAANVIHDDVLRPHVRLIHKLADHGQNHLRRGVGVIVRLHAVLAVVQIDFDGHDFARLIAALVHAAGIFVVILKDCLPGPLAVGGAGELEQRGGQHGIHARLIGVGVQPPLIALLLPIARPLCRLRIARPHHAAGIDAPRNAHRLVRFGRNEIPVRRRLAGSSAPRRCR